MLLKNFLSSYIGLRRENRLHRLSIFLCLLAIVILLFLLISRNEIVVITPYTQSGDAWVGKENASQSYKEAWGLFFAQELGNVTPANVDFLKDRIGPLLSSGVYKDFMGILGIQAQQIKEDRVVLRFEPSSVEYEKETDRVFVTGRLYTRGFSDKESSEERTYEFQITIGNYAPRLLWMDIYRGLPRTLKRQRQTDHRKGGKS